MIDHGAFGIPSIATSFRDGIVCLQCVGNSNAILPMTTIVGSSFATPVELMPNARHEPRGVPRRLHALVRRCTRRRTKEEASTGQWLFLFERHRVKLSLTAGQLGGIFSFILRNDTA